MILAGVVRGTGQALITTVGRTAGCATRPVDLTQRGRVRVDPFSIRIAHGRLTVGLVVAHAGVHATAKARYGIRDDFSGEPFALDNAFGTIVVLSPSLTREAEHCENRG
jgi:hypothetical protein